MSAKFIVVVALAGNVAVGTELQLRLEREPGPELETLLRGIADQFADHGVVIAKATLLRRGQQRHDGEYLNVDALLGRS